jgi:hypothetical protein
VSRDWYDSTEAERATSGLQSGRLSSCPTDLNEEFGADAGVAVSIAMAIAPALAASTGPVKGWCDIDLPLDLCEHGMRRRLSETERSELRAAPNLVKG